MYTQSAVLVMYVGLKEQRVQDGAAVVTCVHYAKLCMEALLHVSANRSTVVSIGCDRVFAVRATQSGRFIWSLQELDLLKKGNSVKEFF